MAEEQVYYNTYNKDRKREIWVELNRKGGHKVRLRVNASCTVYDILKALKAEAPKQLGHLDASEISLIRFVDGTSFDTDAAPLKPRQRLCEFGEHLGLLRAAYPPAEGPPGSPGFLKQPIYDAVSIDMSTTPAPPPRRHSLAQTTVGTPKGNLYTPVHSSNGLARHASALELSRKKGSGNSLTTIPDVSPVVSPSITPVAVAGEPCEVCYPFTAMSDDQMCVNRGDVVTVVDESDSYWWHCRSEHAEGWIPSACFKPTKLADASWFHGRLGRVPAEELLKGTVEGSFLMRESESAEGQYSLSQKLADSFAHYRIIQQEDGTWTSFKRQIQYKTVLELVLFLRSRRTPAQAKQAGLIHPLLYPIPRSCFSPPVTHKPL